MKPEESTGCCQALSVLWDKSTSLRDSSCTSAFWSGGAGNETKSCLFSDTVLPTWWCYQNMWYINLHILHGTATFGPPSLLIYLLCSSSLPLSSSLPSFPFFLSSSLPFPPLSCLLSRAHFGQSNASLIALDNVRCSGNEHELINCRHPAWGTHNCAHSEDAGVACTSELEVMWLNLIG